MALSKTITDYINESIFYYVDRETIWYSKTGDYKIKDMPDKHIVNLINYLESRKSNNSIIPLLYKELELRVGSFKYF